MEKRLAKHRHLNALFEGIVRSAAEAAGMTLEVTVSSILANQLIMFPETGGVVVAADTPQAENVERMWSGLLGGMSRTLIATDGSILQRAYSTNSAALAIAAILRGMAMEEEATKVEEAVAGARPHDGGASILSALY